MFETYDQARLPSTIFTDETTIRWAYIAQTSNDLWFYATHEVLQDGDPDMPYQRQYLIPAPQYLLGLASTDTEIAYVKAVQLVTPPWLNESERWLMEPLIRVRAVGNTLCYELENGDIYPREQAEAGRKGEVLWERPKYEQVQ